MMMTKWIPKLAVAAAILVLAVATSADLSPAFAQKHGGGGHSGGHGGGHESGESGCAGCGDTGHSGGHHAGGKGKQHRGPFMGRGGRSQSLRDIFHDLDSGPETDHSSSRGEHDLPK